MKKKKWKLHLYFNGIQIKVIPIPNEEDPSKNSYVITAIGHKNIFGRNIAKLIVRPVELLKTEDKKKRIHYGVVFERGVDMT